MKHFFIIVLLSITASMYSQDFINCSKDYLITRLKDNGFKTNSEAHYFIKDSSSQVIALFNEFRYSRIEYHLSNNFCDSISCRSSCNECFDGTLNAVLSNKKRKWKKSSENEFISIKKSIKANSKKEFKVLKLRITSNKRTGELSFLMYNIWISQSEFKQLKKVKKHREVYSS